MQSSTLEKDRSVQIQISKLSPSKESSNYRRSIKELLTPLGPASLYEQVKHDNNKIKESGKQALSKSPNPFISLKQIRPVQQVTQLERIKNNGDNNDAFNHSMIPLMSKLAEMKQRDKQIVQRFNPYKMPPNLEDCQFHRAVTQFGVPLERNLHMYDKVEPQATKRNHDPTSLGQQEPKRATYTDRQRCACCSEQPKKKLPIFCRIEDIYKVNESLGFYFTYIKVMITLLIITTLSLGTYSIIQVITNCDTSSNCMYVYGIPVERFHVFFNYITDIIAGCVILIIYFFAVYLYYTNAHQHRKVFLDVNRPVNFSVLISNVDHQKVSGQAILDHFKDYQIVDVLYTHQFKKYLNKLKEKQRLLAKKKILQIKNQRKDISKRVAQIQIKIDDINSYLFHIKKKLTLNVQKIVRTDKIIIKFKTIDQKILFQNQSRKGFCNVLLNTIRGKSQIQINGNHLHLEHLGQPYQILWQNFQISSQTRLFRVIVGTFLTLVVLAGSFVFAAVVLRLQKTDEVLESGLISLIFSLGVSFVNFILQEIIQRFTEWQKRYTQTSKYRIMLLKNFFGYFLNTTLMPFTFFVISWDSSDQDGLLKNIFTLFILTNIQIPILAYFIEGDIIVKKVMRWFIKRKGQECLISQIDANEYFEMYDFKLNAKFGKVLQAVANSFFYAAFFPIGMLITLLGLIIRYWSSKIFLLNFCTIPKQSYRLGKLVNDMTVFFPCILAFGYAFNSLMIPGQFGFNRTIPFIIAGLTIPCSILFLIYGNKLAQKIVLKKYSELKNNPMTDGEIGNQAYNHVADYRELNPTTYIHLEVQDYVNQTEFQTMWDHVLNYAQNQGRRPSERGQVRFTKAE